MQPLPPQMAWFVSVSLGASIEIEDSVETSLKALDALAKALAAHLGLALGRDEQSSSNSDKGHDLEDQEGETPKVAFGL